jgi:hypothetical protein
MTGLLLYLALCGRRPCLYYDISHWANLVLLEEATAQHVVVDPRDMRHPGIEPGDRVRIGNSLSQTLGHHHGPSRSRPSGMQASQVYDPALYRLYGLAGTPRRRTVQEPAQVSLRIWRTNFIVSSADNAWVASVFIKCQ